MKYELEYCEWGRNDWENYGMEYDTKEDALNIATGLLENGYQVRLIEPEDE